MSSPGPSQRPLHTNRGRAESFGTVAANYDRYRPTYPAAMVDDLAALGARTVLDVGCGTGKAATLFAARGMDVLGVEVDAKMADVARSHGITVEVGSFEDWEPAGRTFDLLISGQAWHWVDPARGARKAAEVLRHGGAAAMFWNHDHPDEALRGQFDAIYREHAPELAAPPDADHAEVRRARLVPFQDDPGFASVEMRSYWWERTFTADEWVGMSLTYSDHLLLDPAHRTALADALRAAIDTRGGITVRYETFLNLAHRTA